MVQCLCHSLQTDGLWAQEPALISVKLYGWEDREMRIALDIFKAISSIEQCPLPFISNQQLQYYQNGLGLEQCCWLLWSMEVPDTQNSTHVTSAEISLF